MQDNHANPWPLAGRTAETDAFDEVWESPRIHSVIVHGDPGTGKTRLAEEFLRRASSKPGVRAGRVSVTATAAAVPLGPLAQFIPVAVDMSDPVEAFTRIAGSLVGRKKNTWAVLVDDLHLLDGASAVLLRQLQHAGIIRIIGTVRSGESAGPAVQALQEGDGVHRFDVGAIDREQADSVLQAALGRPIDRHSLDRLHTASGGNLLYLRETVIRALRNGSLTSDGEIWSIAEDASVGSPGLRQIIQHRISSTDPESRAVLDHLAFCEPAGLSELQSQAPMEKIIGLEEDGLIQVEADHRRTVARLAHPLYGEVLRDSAGPERGRELHLLQAAQVRRSGARRRSDALLVATRELAATGKADPDLLARAASTARHAHDYDRVIRLVQAIPDGARSTATWLMLGDAYFQTGRWNRAEAVLASADSTARTEPEIVGVALIRTANSLWGGARLDDTVAVNEAAARRVRGSAGRRMLRINEGYLRTVASQPVQGLEILTELDDEVMLSSDVNAWLRGAFLRPAGLALTGQTDRAIGAAEEAYRVHRQLDERALVSNPAVERIPLVLALTESGRLAEACEVGTATYAELTTSGRLERSFLAAVCGRAEWVAGHPASARRWWAEAATLARAVHWNMVLRLALSGLAASAAVLGDLEAAESALEEHRGLPDLPPAVLSAGEEGLGEAWLSVARGETGRAQEVLWDAVATARKGGHVSGEALLLTDLARTGAAEAVKDRLLELTGVCDGGFVVARARFAAALATRDPDRLAAVAASLKAIGADLLAGEAAVAAGALWNGSGAPRKAAASNRSAQGYLAPCQGAVTPLLKAAGSVSTLTDREEEVARMAAEGTSSKDIAAVLHLSVRTVDNHLQRAFAKLGVTTRNELRTAIAPEEHPPAG